MYRRVGLGVGCVLLLAGLLSNLACDNTVPVDQAGSAAAAGSGTLRVLITDKPFPFDCIEQAIVTIQRVEVRQTCGDDGADDDTDGTTDDADGTVDDNDDGTTDAIDDPDGTLDESVKAMGAAAQAAGEDGLDALDDPDGTTDDENPTADEDDGTDDDDDGTDDEDDGGSPWIVIYDAAAAADNPGGKEFDLLQLQNGQTDLLAEAEIEAGCYSQMRIVVTGGKVLLTDGRMFDLKVPSGAQTGIKLHFTFEVVTDEVTPLLLDVDVSEAFKPIPGGKIGEDCTGAIRSFMFRPSLAMRLVHIAEAGGISGLATDDQMNPLTDVSVTAFDENDEAVTTTATEIDGMYLLSGLLPGTYRVEFSADGYEDASVEGVVVLSGEATAGVDALLAPETAPADAGG